MASGRRGVRLQKAACCRLESGGLQRASERGGSAGCYVTGVVCRRTCALLKSSFVFRDRATYETVFVRSWRKVDVTFCKIWTRSRTNTGPSGCQVINKSTVFPQPHGRESAEGSWDFSPAEEETS